MKIVCILIWIVVTATMLSLWIWGYLKRVKEVKDACSERFGTDCRKQLLVRWGYIGWNIGLAGVAAFFVYRYASGWFAIIRLLVMFVAFAAAAIVDLLVHKIPNILVVIVLLARGIIWIPEIICQPSHWLQTIAGSVISMLAAFILLLILSKLSRGGLGMGDVKLITAQAFLCGVYSVMNTLIFGLLVCVVAAIILVLSSKKGMKDAIAFGPFLYIGYVISLFLGAF